MMKLFFSLLLAIASTTCFAQKTLTLKGGTIVPVKAIQNVRATQVEIGQNIDFQVASNVMVDNQVAIPAGTIVKGKVYEAKRSTAFGTRGRLGIELTHMYGPNGEFIPFTSSNIYIKGKNRTALSVVIFCLTCLPFPCGSKAELTCGVEYSATIASNTTITLPEN